jgi:hypothetical protein
MHELFVYSRGSTTVEPRDRRMDKSSETRQGLVTTTHACAPGLYVTTPFSRVVNSRPQLWFRVLLNPKTAPLPS